MNEEENKFHLSDTIKETIREKVDTGKNESIFVGIVDENNTDYYCYGNTAKDGNPIDENTIFEIGSISKVFTCIILADMVAKGEINLDDPVEKFLPENLKVPSRNGKKITLLNLATHTSGLPRMHSLLPDPKPDEKYHFTKDGMYNFLSGHELTREIGSQYEYSNTGASLLAHALSLQEGKSYEQTLKETIIDELGMNSTCVNQCDELRDRFAKPHHLGKIVDELNLPDEMAGAGGIKSSGKDMLVFLSYVMGLKDSRLQSAFELAQTVNHKINEMMSIGLGWHIITQDNRNIVWHNGGTDGFVSFTGYDSDSKNGAVVLSNTMEPIDRIGLELFGLNVEELINSQKN